MPTNAAPSGVMAAVMHGTLPRLTEALRRARYAGPLDVAALAAGEPAGFLPVLHFALLGASQRVAAWLCSERSGLSPAMTDTRFVTAAHRVMRDHLGLKPALTTQQLLAAGFAERKMQLCLDALGACRAKHAELAGCERRQSRGAEARTPRGGCSACAPATAAHLSSPRTRMAVISSAQQTLAPPSPIANAMASPIAMASMGVGRDDDDDDDAMPRSAPPPRPVPALGAARAHHL
jgi:hypothetical protein